MRVWRTMTAVMRQRDAVGHLFAHSTRGSAILVLLAICFLESPFISSADVAKDSATSQSVN